MWVWVRGCVLYSLDNGVLLYHHLPCVACVAVLMLLCRTTIDDDSIFKEGSCIIIIIIIMPVVALLPYDDRKPCDCSNPNTPWH